MSQELNFINFRKHLASTFYLKQNQNEEPLKLQLEEVEEQKGDIPEGFKRPFSLLFHTQKDTSPLVQNTYQVSHEEMGDFLLFLVPVQPTKESFLYEAIFS